MELVIALVVGIVVLMGLGGIALFIARSQSGAGQAVKALHESLDKMQSQLQAQQHEFARSEELKAANLRTELSQQLQSNRQELQLGLQQASQGLETRFHTI